jgi:CRP/FNR family transcriptional regulator
MARPAATTDLRGELCSYCGVRSPSACGPLDRADLDFVRSFRTAARSIPAGHDFLIQNETVNEVFTLLEGWVILYEMLEDGRRQIMQFCLPGAFLGFQPNAKAPLPFSAQALTDVRVCAFPRAGIEDLLREDPALSYRLACITLRDRSLAFRHLTNVGRRSARERVANLLLEMFLRARMMEPGGGADTIYLPLTQEHIGDALGLTSVHVNRTLRALRVDGIVSVRGRTLRVLDPDRLAEEAGYPEDVSASLFSG